MPAALGRGRVAALGRGRVAALRWRKEVRSGWVCSAPAASAACDSGRLSALHAQLGSLTSLLCPNCFISQGDNPETEELQEHSKVEEALNSVIANSLGTLTCCSAIPVTHHVLPVSPLLGSAAAAATGAALRCR